MDVNNWDANQWSAAAAAGSAVAAFLSFAVAGVSLVVAWNARQIQGRSADFANCVEVVQQLGVAMRRVRDAPEKYYRFEFTELLNLLEALALLCNESKIAPATKKITCKFLEESLGWIRGDDSMKQLMKDSVTGAETYAELQAFEERRRHEIAKHAKSYAIQRGLR
jgi:hypothetical protein